MAETGTLVAEAGESPGETAPVTASNKMGGVRAWPWVLAGLVVAAAVVERAWLAAHIAINSDEAVVGEMALAAQHGHFTAFYWGQYYGGVESYVVALASWVTGHSWVAVVVAPAFMALVMAFLVWGIVVELTGDRALGALAGALAFAWPQADVIDSIREWGFRAVTVCCGFAVLWLVLRIRKGPGRWWQGPMLGLLVGIGWWSSPEIAFWFAPAGLVLIGAVWRALRGRRWRASGVPAAGAVAGFLAGALPWIWANVRSGLASLDTSGIYDGGSTFHSRLIAFFRTAFPMQLGIRHYGGAWLGSTTVGHAVWDVVLIVLGVVAILCVIHRGPSAWIVAGLATFPFIYATNPGTWYSDDGRYAVGLAPFVCILGAVACDEIARRFTDHRRDAALASERAVRRRLSKRAGVRRAIATVFLVIGTVGTALSVNTGFGGAFLSPHRFGTDWDIETRVEHSISILEADRVVVGWADYWMAYVLDYESDNRLRYAGVGPDRWPVLRAKVTKAPQQAWLFFAPDPATLNDARGDYPGSTGGPVGFTEQRFEGILRSKGVGYRVVHAGDIDAVVPSRVFTPADAGITSVVFNIPR